MSNRLSWDEIKGQYPNEWVELIDYEWDETEPDPKSGTVRVHSHDRKEFEELIRKDSPEDSTLVYVGKITSFFKNFKPLELMDNAPFSFFNFYNFGLTLIIIDQTASACISS